ncbi:MAG: hypothetical protein QM820_31500 [Minicystis sp.]
MIPARPTLLRHAKRAAGPFAAIAALSQAGCYFTDEGLSPPTKAFYYPTGLAVSPGRGALYVANSDFDLQYNGGTVQVIDLRETRKTLRETLAGIRCVQGAKDACDAIGKDAASPPSIGEICNVIPFRSSAESAKTCAKGDDCESGVCVSGHCAGGAGNGTDCSARNECASGVCTDGKCVACARNDECPSGVCHPNGRCALAENDNKILTPSACTPLAPAYAANGKTFATIGAFASGAVLAMNPGSTAGEARLFIPVRGDPSITWFRVVDDRAPDFAGDVSPLDCGQAGTDRRCFQDYRVGLDPYDNLRTATLPVEPVGMDISEDGQVLVSAHQIDSAPSVGLTVNPWDPPTARPTFEFSLSSNVPVGPTEVGRVPAAGYVKARQAANSAFTYQPGFLVTYNATAELDLFRYNDDALSSPPKPFITRAAVTGVATNADGKDSRGIAVDDHLRRECEAGCTDDATKMECLRACVDVPLDVFIANRAPPSLLLGRVRTTIVDSDQGSAFDVPEIYDVVSLAVGPSKVALGSIIGMDGKRHPRIFAVTFESRFVFSYDPEARRVDAVIRTGRGPHAIAFDTGDDGDGLHSYLYVGHFTDSYLGVVDLDMRHPETFGIMFASIGTPTPPRESK